MKPKFFKVAQIASKHSTHPQHKLGAVIVKKNQILSIGFNKYKTHPKAPHPFKHIHAEFDAIIKMDHLADLENATIYLYREWISGKMANSKPCPSCRRLLKLMKIKNICYTSEDGYKIEKV